MAQSRTTNSKAVLVLVSFSSKREAQRISKFLLKRKLIASFQLFECYLSSYHWKGKITQGKECLAVYRTFTSKHKTITSKVREMHSYELPEIIVIPITKMERLYQQWIKKSLQEK